MRRPRFSRWIRLEVLRLSGMQRFNLRKCAAQAQREESPELAAALLLYAHENHCFDRLMSLVYDDALRREFQEVERHLGTRTVERLSLRGTPMMSLPARYRALMAEYERAYHTPERIAAEKRMLSQTARRAVLESGASPTELARTLGLDRSNLNAYLFRGETHRLNMEAARKLAELAA